jgi:hypothetical protein
VLCARGDGTGFFTPETSKAKAVAAAAFKRSTTELAEVAAKGSAFWKTVPVILDGQALPTPGGAPLVRAGGSSAASAAAAGPASRISNAPTPQWRHSTASKLLKKAHLLPWRPRPRAQRTGSTLRARLAGAASHVDLFEQFAGLRRVLMAAAS